MTAPAGCLRHGSEAAAGRRNRERLGLVLELGHLAHLAIGVRPDVEVPAGVNTIEPVGPMASRQELPYTESAGRCDGKPPSK